jgi:putative Ca2+/H+ antiporter (TMEM165/GDT1 family)
MESLLISTGVVALAEIGDKTQLLAFLLAARFKKPVPIILGILAATLLNHGLAGAAGAWIAALLPQGAMRWALGISFAAMAIWVLVPDKADDAEDSTPAMRGGFGVFGATFGAFFLAEMGDKTQAATVALAAHYGAPLLVVAGTTLGMLLADVPAVFIGGKLAERLPLAWLRGAAALVFGVLGVLTLAGAGASLGI